MVRQAGCRERGFGHTEVPGVEEKEIEQSPDDDDEVISRLQRSIEVFVVIVHNIQMTVEKIEKIEVHQLQFLYQMAGEQL